MPDWLKKLARDWALNKTTSAGAEQIKNDPAAVLALKKYRAGGAFMEIVKTYVMATSNREDDAVVDDLMTRPFNEVLARLAGPMIATKIPDMDGDPTNDITVGDFLARVIDKVVAEEAPAEEPGS